MRIQDLFTTAKILALVIIIVAGVVQLCRGKSVFYYLFTFIFQLVTNSVITELLKLAGL